MVIVDLQLKGFCATCTAQHRIPIVTSTD